MREEQDNAGQSDQALAQVAAAGLVATKVMDCLLQTLMNKSILLPSEVNDIYRASALLIQQAIPADDHTKKVQELALADLADRLGETD
ncbi:hypothetical protein [Kaistia terrae]|uniref:Uncharacterized protein n=1 Tax=Kaistia terrae TaxID=537017 RepID=A0ABW0Q272_9HYPH|nr:hypothetical protein [Kaistia terrae]MCX5581590.1 hypothetical protein [Kaistia terrae]